jgi:hypothetical protein
MAGGAPYWARLGSFNYRASAGPQAFSLFAGASRAQCSARRSVGAGSRQHPLESSRGCVRSRQERLRSLSIGGCSSSKRQKRSAGSVRLGGLTGHAEQAPVSSVRQLDRSARVARATRQHLATPTPWKRADDQVAVAVEVHDSPNGRRRWIRPGDDTAVPQAAIDEKIRISSMPRAAPRCHQLDLFPRCLPPAAAPVASGW